MSPLTVCLALVLVGCCAGQHQQQQQVSGERQVRLEDIERDAAGRKAQQYSAGQQYSTGGQQYSAGGQQYSAGSQQYSAGGQQYSAGSQQGAAGSGAGPAASAGSPQQYLPQQAYQLPIQQFQAGAGGYSSLLQGGGPQLYLPQAGAGHGLQFMLLPQLDTSLSSLLYQSHQPFILPQQQYLLPQQSAVLSLPPAQHLSLPQTPQFVLPPAAQHQPQTVLVPRYQAAGGLPAGSGLKSVSGSQQQQQFRASPQVAGHHQQAQQLGAHQQQAQQLASLQQQLPAPQHHLVQQTHQQQVPRLPQLTYQSQQAPQVYNPYNAIYHQHKYATGVKSTAAPPLKESPSQPITSYANFKTVY